MTAALRATASERNTDISSRNDRTTTPPMNSGSRLAVSSLSSMNAAVVPPTDASAPVPPTAPGSTSSRSVCTRLSVASSCGPVVGTTVSTAASPASLSAGGNTVATPSVACRSPAMRSTVRAADPASLAAARAEVDGDQQRAVRPRPEALPHQVVRPAAGQVGRAVAGVGHAEPEVGRRGGQHQQHGQGAEPRHQGPPLHDPAPPPRQRAAAIDVVAEPRQAQPVDRAAGEAEQRRQHGHRREHHHRHRQRRRQCDAPQVVAAHQHEAEDRDHDGAAGEHDGPPGGRSCDDDGLAGRVALGQRRPVAGHDEQGVVDADADADHRGELHPEVGHVDDVGHQRDAAERHAQAEPGDDEGQSGGQRGAERDHQDQERRNQPDRLGAGLALLDRLDRVSAELDPQPVALGLAGEVHHPLDRLGGQLLRGQVEPHLHHPGRAVGGDRPGLGGDDVVDLGDFAGERVDAGRGGRAGDPVRSGVHDVDGAAGEAGEALLQQLHGLGRVAARHREVDLVVAAGDAGEHRRGHERGDPQDHDASPTVVAPGHEPAEHHATSCASATVGMVATGRVVMRARRRRGGEPGELQR